MTQERFEEIRDTYNMDAYSMLSDAEYAEFVAMSTAADNTAMLTRWGHIDTHTGGINNRPLRTIIGRNG